VHRYDTNLFTVATRTRALSKNTEKHNYCRNFSRIRVALIAMGYIAPYH
jgi:hypothetical protein